MFDIGWQELFIVAVLAIIVVGPKDLPRALRTVTGWLRKAKGMARDFQSGIDDIVREADLDDIRKEAQAAAGFSLEDEIRNTIDPTGEVTKELEDLSSVTDEEEAATEDEAEDEAEGEADEQPVSENTETEDEAEDPKNDTSAEAPASAEKASG